MARPYRLALTEDEFAERYTELCNYIEAMWSKRKSKEYWNVQPKDILPVVSPQSRKVAMHICELLGIDYVRPTPRKKVRDG
jgi:hypothetical protein